MWLQQRLKGLPGLLSSSWARRLLAGLLLLLIMYWYLTSDGILRLLTNSSVPRGVTGVCLQSEMQRWKALVDRGDGIIIEPQSIVSGPALVGNGYVMVDIETNTLWVSSQTGSIPAHHTDYPPLVALKLDEVRAEARASLLWFRKGSVLSVQCLLPGQSQAARNCVTLREEYLAHRSRPHLYIQRIYISNPTEKVAVFDVSSPSPSFGGKFSSSIEKIEDKEFILSSGRVVTEKNQVMLVIIISKKIGSKLQVAAKSEFAENVLSVVFTSEPIDSSAKVEEVFSRLRDSAKKEMAELLRMSMEDLYQEHQQAWNNLFLSGIEMRKITDFHTPSGVTVNKTLYYVLSSSPAPLLEKNLSPEDNERLESSLNYADHCFSGHATMHAENLWPEQLHSAAHILQLVTLWNLTLQKRGCKVLVTAGAQGVMQGMVLSFGGLQFTENHLQFQADPDVLHNSYLLHGIHYNKDLINLAVLLDTEGKPFLHVLVKSQDTPVKLYACEAGCTNEPVELTSEVKGHTFPVLVTQPITPLLYISTDLTHLQDLRHTLHLKAILAHEEHMAKQYPGLPFLFWFSVASLITLFHLFLFKLIYNEYCGPGAKPLFRSKDDPSV
ncbi:uncharacterized protein KIAA2013 homolog [Polypterus senegalus]|uniref:uncharacterized protein KIAA2013 homolog n=1 Tax=Polypterus senegalus TaxID=55291 RepID=UPI001963096C|nr:uncharacterized protein KIAA2013 homolog [Polypterus senegalus]